MKLTRSLLTLLPLLPPLAIASPLPDAVRAALEAAAPPWQRMEGVTRPLLGTPYALDPLGEGVPPDADPFVRYDAFDCQTFVEEALALSLAGTPADVDPIRLGIRYGVGPYDYDHRRHFPEFQWIPGNIADGWIVETTAEYGPTRRLTVTADDATWTQWAGIHRMKLTEAARPTGEATIAVIPIRDAVAIAATVRPGSIVLIAQEPRAYTPLLTTHMGIVVAPGRFRHASTTARAVTEEDLGSYLRRAAERRSWPVAGIAVFEPNPARAHH